eukprot:TRINITY_DN2885_c0_g1_i1.p1 TRINITY_DN2885_c0_g1~~TRINITY_DN2885_c0_g1_i1.p1  ORF type:complete len:578 (-),score=135.11 TRINITY_DN2885_c0_g1_i1:227-1960(-)
MYSHRIPVNARILELLENLKAEFESLAHESNVHKMQKDDLERKLQAQLNELNNVQTTLFELERTHTKIKQQYDEETLRLKRQVDLHSQNGSTPSFHPSNNNEASSRPTIVSEKPISSLGNSTGMFGNFAAGTLAPIVDLKRNNFAASAPKRARPESDSSFYPLGQSLPSLSGLTDANPSKLQKTEKVDPPAPFSLSNTAFREPVKDTSAIGRSNGAMHSLLESHTKDSPPNKEVVQPSVKQGQGSGPLESKKREPVDDKSESDWYPQHNAQSSLKVDLCHSLEHQSVVCCVKFSHDAKLLATGCNKSAQIFDVETGEMIKCFTDETVKDADLYIRSVCFSPDGKYLAAGAEDKTVKIWDIEHNTSCHTFSGHELDIYSLDFSQNGNIIVSGSGDKKAKIWDMSSGKCLHTLGNDETGPKDGVTSVALSPDGRYVAAGSLDHIVRLWDVQTGQFLDKFEGHADSVYSVAFSPDGKSLASGSLDKTIKLWDVSQSTRMSLKCTFQGHKDFVLSVAFSPDGQWLVSGSKDRTVHFWDPRNGSLQTILHGHKNSVISVALSPQNGMFATGSGDYRARIWKF